jgi:hypothetical protein
MMIWAELQDGLYLVFGPIWFWWIILVAVGGIVSALGSVFLEIAARMSTGR